VPEHKLQGRGKKGADHRSSSILSLSGFPIETAGELALSGRIGLRLTLDLGGRTAVLEDGALPGNVEETRFKASEESGNGRGADTKLTPWC
jgi:hypothetical protein